ncbi:MAG: hypothetical protein ACXWFZ_12230 [Nitrososphaeraceae archaeon]
MIYSVGEEKKGKEKKGGGKAMPIKTLKLNQASPCNRTTKLSQTYSKYSPAIMNYEAQV